MKVNALEEIVAIKLGINFWPGQVQLKPEDSGKKDLNILGDVQVEDALTQLRAALNGTDVDALKDNEALKQQLADLSDQVAAVNGKLDDVSALSGNYKRMIDLSD